MKKVFIIQLFIFALVQQIFAYDIEVDGIYYNLSGSTAKVTYKNKSFPTPYYSPYSGDIVIPRSIIYENQEYMVDSIDDGAFYACKNLTSVTIPDGLKHIGQEAFAFSSLKFLKIPNSVKTIYDHAFAHMHYLEEIILPEELEFIDHGLFENSGIDIDTELKKVVMPKKCKYIGENAFLNQRVLEEFDFPENLEYIGDYAFNYCRKLKKQIQIPNSVSYIGKEAFYKTYFDIKQIPSSMKVLTPFAFYGAMGLKELTIPDWITEIPKFCFLECYYLITVNFSNVESIGVGAFASDENLKTILLPASIKKIEDRAFRYCHKLQSVFSLSKEPSSLGKDVFDETPDDIKLYVPTGCTEAYKAAGWGEYFSEIIEMDEANQRSAFAKSVTGVTTIVTPSKANAGYFNLQGQKLDAPQKGINILRTEDGKTKKVYVK